MKDFGQVLLHCHASISCIANPASGWGVGISANWLHLPLTPGSQLAEVMAFAMPPWQRSSTAAICWLPESHFLDKHGSPMEMWLLICDGWKGPSSFRGILRNLLGHYQMWNHYFIMDIILLLPASHVRRMYSISKESIRNSTLPPKISVFEQNQKRNEVLLFCFGFPIGDAEYLITASQGHEFLFGFLPELWWLIPGQEQISGWSQWTLLFCPDLAVPVSLLKGLQVHRRKTSVHTYVCVCGQKIYIYSQRFYNNVFVMEISYWRKNLIKYKFSSEPLSGKAVWVPWVQKNIWSYIRNF